MPFFKLTKIYSRQQGNTTFNFYVSKDKQLVAETIRDGKAQQLQTDISCDFQINLDEKKVSELQMMFEQCYFDSQRGKISVNGRGLGGWKDIVHRVYTKRWAENAGFAPLFAQQIAEACKQVDYDESTKPTALTTEALSWHFNTNDANPQQNHQGGSRNDTRIEHAVDFLKQAVYYYKGGNLQQAYQYLGAGLHPLQDMFAHIDDLVKVTFGWHNHINSISDVIGESFVDEPSATIISYPQRLDDTESITYLYLLLFKDAVNLRTDSDFISQLSDQVGEGVRRHAGFDSLTGLCCESKALRKIGIIEHTTRIQDGSFLAHSLMHQRGLKP